MVLEEAIKIVKERGEVYGHPYDDFMRTALIWSGILGINITADQVVKCMIGVKLSRLYETPDHIDSIIDIAGYADCLGEVIDGQKK